MLFEQRETQCPLISSLHIYLPSERIKQINIPKDSANFGFRSSSPVAWSVLGKIIVNTLPRVGMERCKLKSDIYIHIILGDGGHKMGR